MSKYGYKNNGISLKSLKGSIQSMTDAGAVNTTDLITEVTTTGAVAITLANGTEKGQLKIIKMVSDGGDATLTPVSFLDGSSLAFDVTDYAILYWTGAAWAGISYNATLA